MSPEDELSIRSDPNLKFNDSNIYNNNKLYFRLKILVIKYLNFIQLIYLFKK